MPWQFNINTPAIRRVAKGIALCLLALTIFLSALISILIGSETGRVFVVQTALGFISSRSDYAINVQQLNSPKMGEWHFSSLELKQKQRTLLTTKALHLRWQPARLWQKQAVIDSLIVDHLSFHKLEQSQKKPLQQAPFSLAAFLEGGLPQIHIQHLQVKHFSLQGFFIDAAQTPLPPLTVTGSVNLLEGKPATINLNGLSLNAPAARIQLDLSLPESQQIAVRGKIEEASGRGFLGSMLKLPPEQDIELQLLAVFEAKKEAYHFNIQQLETPIANHQVALSGQLNTNLNFSSGEATQVELLVDEHIHHLQARWHSSHIEASANIDQLPIEISSPWQQRLQGGEVSAALTFEGTLKTPKIAGDLTLNTHYQNAPFALRATGSSSGIAANFEQLEGQWGGSRFSAKGKVAWRDADSNLKAQLEQFDLAALETFNITLPKQLRANIEQAEAQMRGRIQDVEGDFTATMSGLYAEQAFNLNATLSKEGNKLDIKNSHLTAASGEARARGMFDIKTLDSKLDIETESLPLSLLTLAGVKLPKQLQAIAKGQCRIEGDLRKPNVSGEASLSGQYQDVPFYLQAKGGLKKQSLNLERLELSTFDKPVLSIQGEISPSSLDMQLKANRLPTKLLSAFRLQIEPGEFSADLKASGDLYTPDIHGNLSYNINKDIPFGWHLDVASKDDTYHAVSLFSSNKQPSGQVSITIPRNPYRVFFQQASPLDIQQLPLVAFSEGQVNLSLASSFIDPELHFISGILHSQLNLSGTVYRPVITSQLDLSKGVYKNPSTGSQLENIQCSLQTEQRDFRIDNCNASDSINGSVKLQGLLRLPNKDDQGFIGISALADQAQFLRRPDIESEASGSIELRGNFSSLLASGKLEIAPLTALIDATYSSNIPKINITKVENIKNTKEDNGEKTSPYLPIINLDFLVSAGQQAYIRGRGLEAELSGEVRLRGTTKNPRYDGEFKTLRGIFEVFGKKFTLEKGQVNFSNHAIALNIEGVYNKNDQLIRAVLTGTAQRPSLSLSAEPSMAEDEILAFIIFGKSVQNISPFEALQLASSAQTLSGGGGSFFDPIGSARALLGVDTLSIETETSDDGETNVNVGVGKYLNEKVYLEIERSPNPSHPWKGNLQIELAPNVHLESATGETSGIDGAKIKWKRDY